MKLRTLKYRFSAIKNTLWGVGLFLIVALILIHQASAAGATCGGPLLSVAGGIASGSPLLGLDDNPAALPCNAGGTLSGAVYSGEPDFNGRLLYGNKGLGVGAGYDNNGQLVLGAGLMPSTSFSLGILASHDVPNNGGWGLDAGIMIHLGQKMHLGAKAYNLSDGINAWGAGLGWDFSQAARFAVDYSFSSQSVGKGVLKPGLVIAALPFELSFSYGIKMADDWSSRISSGTTVGAGLHLSKKIFVSGYYNHVAEYYGSLAFSL